MAEISGNAARNRLKGALRVRLAAAVQQQGSLELTPLADVPRTRTFGQAGAPETIRPGERAAELGREIGPVLAPQMAAERAAMAPPAAPAPTAGAPVLDHLEVVGAPNSARVLAVRTGRPPGRRNRRSEDVARWVVEHLGDPLLIQAAMATMGIERLMALGLSATEAIAEQRLAAAVILPYLHSRRPISVDVATHKRVSLMIVEGSEQTNGETVEPDLESVEIQELAETVALDTIADELDHEGNE